MSETIAKQPFHLSLIAVLRESDLPMQGEVEQVFKLLQRTTIPGKIDPKAFDELIEALREFVANSVEAEACQDGLGATVASILEQKEVAIKKAADKALE